ncbi:hypothetical protein pb186bvf_005344 [Paramecium bursaria]
MQQEQPQEDQQNVQMAFMIDQDFLKTLKLREKLKIELKNQEEKYHSLILQKEEIAQRLEELQKESKQSKRQQEKSQENTNKVLWKNY